MRRDNSSKNELIRNLSVQWSDKDGDYVYTLNNLTEYSDGARDVHSQFTGNKDWATRIAEHYKLQVPEVTE